MNHSDIAALMKGVAPAIASLVATMVQPLVDKVSSLEAELAEARTVDHVAIVRDLVADAIGKLPAPIAGKDADPAVIERMVADAVAALPAPAPGKDADPEIVAALVEEKVAAALAALPSPKDVDPEAVALAMRPFVAETIDAAVKALPPAEPGQSVTLDDVAPMITAAVSEAVAKLPPAEPGKSADPVDTERMVNDIVGRVLAGWDKPQDGKSITVEDVVPLIDDAVAKAVAALPPAKEGPPGKLPLVKEWSDEVAYQGEVRTWSGSTYQALKDTAKEPPHADWQCIAAGGEPGKAADRIEVIGTYSAEASYNRLNIVALNGAAFIARKDDPGVCPGEGWQVIAMRGKPGPPGEGRKGDSIKGEPGDSVVGLSIDGMGMLTLVNGDGSEVTCDLYPLLSKIGRA